MIAASLYAACRDTETPRTLKDIADSANVKEKILQDVIDYFIMNWN
jgi:Transcription initiation factor IIB (TFIIB)